MQMRRRVLIGALALGLALGVIWGGAKPETPTPGTLVHGGIVGGDRAQAGVIWGARAGVVWGS
jgi:hypothetical protein